MYVKSRKRTGFASTPQYYPKIRTRNSLNSRHFEIFTNAARQHQIENIPPTPPAAASARMR
jgi:hypothetical protein